MKLLLVLLLPLLVVGCSPQKSFANRLKGADRLVVTNTYARLSITLTGEEVNKVVEAIAGARKENPSVACSPSLQLQFFRNTEHLATINTCVEVFWIEQGPYKDSRGILKAIDQRYREEHPPRLSP